MAGVVGMAWQPGRGTHGGHVEFQVTAYWSLGGKRGGTGIRTVGVRGGTGESYSGVAAGEFQMTVYWRRGGMRGGVGPYGEGARRYWRAVQWGRYGVAWRYWGVPLTPLTTQGERGGIPWPR